MVASGRLGGLHFFESESVTIVAIAAGNSQNMGKPPGINKNTGGMVPE